jgi:hypothetical protein
MELRLPDVSGLILATVCIPVPWRCQDWPIPEPPLRDGADARFDYQSHALTAYGNLPYVAGALYASRLSIDTVSQR